MSVNKAILVGRLGRDPETRYTSGEQAEIAQQYLRKGSLIFLEGRIQTRQWDDKEGQKRTTVEIVANSFRMLGGRAEGAAAGGGGGMGAGAAGDTDMHTPSGPDETHGAEISDEDIP